MPWFDTNKWMPRDGEKILFHCRSWRKSSWEIGRFSRQDEKIYNHYAGRTFETYDWGDVDYWYKIPSVPTGKKKTMIAEEFVG